MATDGEHKWQGDEKQTTGNELEDKTENGKWPFAFASCLDLPARSSLVTALW